MADILLQNAIAEVSQQIRGSSSKTNYAFAFGKSLKSHIDSLIRASNTTGPYTLPPAAAGFICDLSDVSKISSCNCNYSGSGTSSTAQSNTNNPWNNGSVLKGSAGASVTQASIVTAIRNLNSVLNDIWTQSQTAVGLDIYLAYLSLKNTYTAENNTAILLNWYGIGGGGIVAGVRLSETNKLKVCGASWATGEGATCTWTVPAGATSAKFQVWGAGQGSNSACCCGGASFGESGAYAEMVITVTPGQQYSICAGCSCSRYCCSNNPPGYGCMSGVTGPNICCLKADGGRCYQSNCDDLNYTRCAIGAGGACARFENPYCSSSGPCWCAYGEYCYDNSCATCGVVPVYPSCCYTYGCSCALISAAVKDGPQNVHFGLHGGGCLETSNYGYHIRPPIIDADTGLEFTGGCRLQTFSSGTCCGGCNAAGWTWHPGQGGAGTHVMGGDTNHKGDTGRGGMVQVSWI